MRINFIFLSFFTFYFFNANSQGANPSGPNFLSTGDTNQYDEYLWSSSSSNSNTVVRVTSSQLTAFELKITLEGSSYLSVPAISTRFIPAYTGGTIYSSNIRFPHSGAPPTPAIDGYGIFTFTPVTGTNFNYTPTGAPPVVRRVPFKRGIGHRWIRANINNHDYTAIDEISITTFYHESDYINASTTVHDYTFATTNIYGKLISKKITVTVPVEKPIDGVNHTYVHGNVYTPVRLMPGANLKAVSDEYFLTGGSGNRLSNINDEESEENYKVYPNIVTNNFTIEHLSNDEYQIQVYDLNSQKIIDKFVREKVNIIDTSNLSTGWFIIHLTSNNLTESYKIFKE